LPPGLYVLAVPRERFSARRLLRQRMKYHDSFIPSFFTPHPPLGAAICRLWTTMHALARGSVGRSRRLPVRLASPTLPRDTLSLSQLISAYLSPPLVHRPIHRLPACRPAPLSTSTARTAPSTCRPRTPWAQRALSLTRATLPSRPTPQVPRTLHPGGLVPHRRVPG